MYDESVASSQALPLTQHLFLCVSLAKEGESLAHFDHIWLDMVGDCKQLVGDFAHVCWVIHSVSGHEVEC